MRRVAIWLVAIALWLGAFYALAEAFGVLNDTGVQCDPSVTYDHCGEVGAPGPGGR